jgi:hypothetical protein
MNIPEDISEEVSSELSVTLQYVISTAQDDLPVTLLMVQAMMETDLLEEVSDNGLLDPADHDSVSEELDALVESFGDAAANGFVRPQASEILSNVIENCIDHNSDTGPPTLGQVRRALHDGLVSELISIGEIEDGEEQTIYDEIDRLIDLHGDSAPAGEFLAYP